MPAPDYSLSALLDAANKACELAFEKRAEIDGEINWGDLACHEVRYWYDDRGETGYMVLIEEASQGSSDLMVFIMKELQKSGFENIEVRKILRSSWNGSP